jgi:hypothetical protein
MTGMQIGIMAIGACIQIILDTQDGTVKRRGAKGRQECRYPGITEHARQLGVDAKYLSKVLYGARLSPGLVKRYEQLTGTKVTFED